VPITITRIPDRYRAGLEKINVLSLEVVSAITDALKATPGPFSLKQLESIIERVAGLGSEDANKVTITLHSLYAFMAATECPVAELVQVLMGAMAASGVKALAVTDDNKRDFTSKLTHLLSLKPVERASKIEQLKADHSAIFYDAKIVTDMRPVFDDPHERPIGAIVVHTLKVITHESGQHKELYFALDNDDVATLKKIADRALDKSSSLKQLLTESNLPDLS
jgi:hypothetical protein